MRVTRKIETSSPPEALWPLLVEPEEMKGWMPGLVELVSRDSSDSVAAGSRFVMRLRELGKVAEYEGEVLDYEPPRRLRLKLWGGSFKEAETLFGEYRLEDLGGRTRLVYAVQKDLEGALLKTLKPFLWLLGHLQLSVVLRALRRAAERRRPAAGSPRSEPGAVS